MQAEKKENMVGAKKKSFKFPYVYEALLGMANLMAVFAIFFFLGKVESTAQKIGEVKSASVSNTSTANLETAQARLDQGKSKIDAISAMFAGEDEIVEFVKEMDLLKRDGYIASFSFASDNVVQDKKTRSGVLPFTVIIEGDQTKINYALNKIYSLPFLTSDIVVEITRNEDGSYSFNYGGYLYVNEEFGKN